MRSLVAGVGLRLDRTHAPPFLLELWLDSNGWSRVQRLVGTPRLTPTVVIHSTVVGPGLKSIHSEGPLGVKSREEPLGHFFGDN